MSAIEMDTEKGASSMNESSESTQTVPSRRMSKEEATIVEVERDVDEVQQSEMEVYNPHIDVSCVNEKKLQRKIDWQLIPWLSFLFLLSFLDRTSIGNAKASAHTLHHIFVRLTRLQLYGMEQALHITDTQYLIALTIFFISYAAFEASSVYM